MTDQEVAEIVEPKAEQTVKSSQTRANSPAPPNKPANTKTPEDAGASATEGSAESSPDAHTEATAGANGEIKYDFTRPWTISNKFHQNLASIAETFANQLSFSMTNYLRTTVDVGYKSVKQELFSDYLERAPEAKCFGVFSMQPLKGQSVISADAGLMFVIMDKLIGGQGKSHEVGRDFTEIEIRIFMLVMNKILGDFREAAKKFFESSVHLNRVESTPAFIAVMTGGEKVISMNLEMTIGEHTGSVMIAMPMSGFQPVMSSLDPKDEAILKRHKIPPEDEARIVSALQESSVDVTAVLGCTKITLARLLDLETGDTIVLNHRMNDPIAVNVGKKTVCFGEPGKSQNRKAVKVVSSN